MANAVVFVFILLSFDITDLSHAENELSKLKGIAKIIHTEFDVIDCVDIYQQPAFDHPLLKDHKIELMPSQNIRLQSNISEVPLFYQTWHESGECPEGTVPIRRSEEVDEEVIMKMKRRPIHSNISNGNNNFVHEYAKMRVDDGTYYGTRFATTVWNPHVEHIEASLAQTWIIAGPQNTLNTIEVGWMVNRILYGDYKTRLFIYWTPDGYKTGCYNLKCPGFVQTSRTVVPGYPLPSISQYGSTNYDIWIAVYKVRDKWWLQIGEEFVGYWPAEIFPLLANSADRVAWGGEIGSAGNADHHTTTQMGSGHFASEKYLKAALFHNLQVNTRKDNPKFHRPQSFYPNRVTNSNCYSLLKAENDHTQYGDDEHRHRQFGDHFFYGGPGYSTSCP